MFGEATLPRESVPGSQGQDPGSLQPAELLPAPRWVERSPPARDGAAAEADLCLLLSIRIWDGKRKGLHPAMLPSPLGWEFHLRQEAESGQGKCLIRDVENSTVASPPFPQAGLSCCKLL